MQQIKIGKKNRDNELPQKPSYLECNETLQSHSLDIDLDLSNFTVYFYVFLPIAIKFHSKKGAGVGVVKLRKP